MHFLFFLLWIWVQIGIYNSKQYIWWAYPSKQSFLFMCINLDIIYTRICIPFLMRILFSFIMHNSTTISLFSLSLNYSYFQTYPFLIFLIVILRYHVLIDNIIKKLIISSPWNQYICDFCWANQNHNSHILWPLEAGLSLDSYHVYPTLIFFFPDESRSQSSLFFKRKKRLENHPFLLPPAPPFDTQTRTLSLSVSLVKP